MPGFKLIYVIKNEPNLVCSTLCDRRKRIGIVTSICADWHPECFRKCAIVHKPRPLHAYSSDHVGHQQINLKSQGQDQTCDIETHLGPDSI